MNSLDHGSRSGEPPSAQVLTLDSGGGHGFVVRNLAAQAALRVEVSDVLAAAGCDRNVRFDVTLAVTELLTNAFEHGQTSEVRIRVHIVSPQVIVHLSHLEPGSAHQHSDLDGPHDIVTLTQERGRGLSIVEAVTTAFDQWTASDGTHRTRASFG